MIDWLIYLFIWRFMPYQQYFVHLRAEIVKCFIYVWIYMYGDYKICQIQHLCNISHAMICDISLYLVLLYLDIWFMISGIDIVISWYLVSWYQVSILWYLDICYVVLWYLVLWYMPLDIVIHESLFLVSWYLVSWYDNLISSIVISWYLVFVNHGIIDIRLLFVPNYYFDFPFSN